MPFMLKIKWDISFIFARIMRVPPNFPHEWKMLELPTPISLALRRAGMPAFSSSTIQSVRTFSRIAAPFFLLPRRQLDRTDGGRTLKDA